VELAVYPGSFDPPTVAHLGIVVAARVHAAEVRLVLSEVALGKESGARTPIADRLAVLRADGLSAVATATRLVVDIVTEAGADAVVMGADKWAQVVDPAWYGSVAARDAALARLPTVLLAERSGTELPDLPVDVVVLDVDPAHADVSATRARAGEVDLMAPAARASGLWV
jgi:phosphopantetheine adenylyltransferase